MEKYGAAGTYYISLGLLNRAEPTGRVAILDDVKEVVNRGHELGSHTFWHSHAWETEPVEFEESLLRNSVALKEILPGESFQTASYPISNPLPANKALVGRSFRACRGGGQTFNSKICDLNNLKAFFMEQSRDDPSRMKKLIDLNNAMSGWLIFATHDVDVDVTRFGCPADLFEDIVSYAVQSGAHILTVSRALDSIGAP